MAMRVRTALVLVVMLLGGPLLCPQAVAQHMVEVGHDFDNAVPATQQKGTRKPKPRAPPNSVATGGYAPVILFAADWCGYCRMARAYLSNHAIAYTEYNPDSQDGAAAMAAYGSSRGIPLLVVGPARVRGFSAEAYDAVFQQQFR